METQLIGDNRVGTVQFGGIKRSAFSTSCRGQSGRLRSGACGICAQRPGTRKKPTHLPLLERIGNARDGTPRLKLEDEAA